jgi:NAD(P)-dependent dehydrogenase (short-subunit alcohol dehydrogenase family)
MIDLQKSVAVVTGAASGIGLASTRRLFSEGAQLVIIDKNTDALAKVASEYKAVPISGDVGLLSTWSAVREAVVKLNKPLGVLHLNAGIAPNPGDIDSISYEEYDKVISTNINGVFYGVKELLTELSKGASVLGESCVVVTASMASLIGFSLSPVYCLTKHAVAGLVRSLEQPFKAKSIRINALCPSFVDTPLLGDQAKYAISQLGFEMLAPEEIAEALMFCLRNDISGQCVICQVGLPPIIYQYRGVPGPHGEFTQ